MKAPSLPTLPSPSFTPWSEACPSFAFQQESISRQLLGFFQWAFLKTQLSQIKDAVMSLVQTFHGPQASISMYHIVKKNTHFPGTFGQIFCKLTYICIDFSIQFLPDHRWREKAFETGSVVSEKKPCVTLLLWKNPVQWLQAQCEAARSLIAEKVAVNLTTLCLIRSDWKLNAYVSVHTS